MSKPLSTQHPYLDLFTASLVPHMLHGPGHEQDPPRVDRMLSLEPSGPEAKMVLDLLLGADHDLRGDHTRAAGINLDLAETRLELAIAHDGPKPELEAALAGIRLAREELLHGQQRRACAAVCSAIRAVLRPAHGPERAL
ncbi:MAG: hypothetical protein QJR07_15320 [Acetobacteraceae bacterium]|nr:hypothetical protein [Acetobacteraceae bacterium]MDI3308461.1 hypothetical protein [Acetobacteraceae bacterium]